MIFRCGNMSAVVVAETRRARSPAMRCALAWLSRAEAALGAAARLEHIPTKESRLADALSRYSAADTDVARKIRGVKDTTCDKSRIVLEGRSLDEICVEIEQEIRSALLADDFEDAMDEAQTAGGRAGALSRRLVRGHGGRVRKRRNSPLCPSHHQVYLHVATKSGCGRRLQARAN